MSTDRPPTLRTITRSGTWSAITVMVLTAGLNPAHAADRPNIVVILADNMGYGDVHDLNPDSRVPTPNLNRLMKSGMAFTDAHTPSAVRTPTRHRLITGRYCWRSRLKKWVQNGYEKPSIEDDRPTIASFLKANGYRTGIVGQRHLGLGFVGPSDDRIDYGKPFEKPYQLFDLTSELEETKNLIEQHPHFADELEKAALQIRDNELTNRKPTSQYRE